MTNDLEVLFVDLTALKVNHSLETIGDGGDQVPDHHLVLIKLLILATTRGGVLFCPPEPLNLSRLPESVNFLS